MVVLNFFTSQLLRVPKKIDSKKINFLYVGTNDSRKIFSEVALIDKNIDCKIDIEGLHLRNSVFFFEHFFIT
jgi:hypothetical protein